MSRRGLDLSGAALIVAAVVVLGFAGWLLATWPPEPPRSTGLSYRPIPSPPATTPVEQPVATFLGDSYTQGIGADDPSYGFACRTAELMGWLCDLNGQTGTGYVNDGSRYAGHQRGFAAYPDRVAQVISADPDVVVVSGGRNDFDGATLGEITSAAASVVKRLDGGLPDAEIVVVAPFWTDGDPPDQLLDLRDALEEIAVREDATFVDPLAGDWITDADAKLIAKDGIHVNERGHRRLARELAEALRATGVSTE